MANILSILLGLVALLLAIPSFIPGLGVGNWIVVPIALIGLLFGFLSRSNGGRNLCLVVIVIGIVRLSLGGGFL